MAQALFYSSNAVAMTLAAGIASGDTTCNLSSTSGLPASFPFKLLIGWGTAQQEVVHCTALSGVVATIARGQDGTTAQAHSIGATVVHGVSAREFNDLELHVGSSAAVHGITGSVVGTTDAQALTNKTFDATSNVSGAPLVGTTTVQTLTNKTLDATNSVAKAAVAGAPVGAFVGTTDTQTLTGKTLTGAALDATSTVNGVTGTQVASDHSTFGTMLAAWTSYTPTFTNCTSPVGTFRYLEIGKAVLIRANFSGGTATSAAGISFTLPNGWSGQTNGNQLLPGIVANAFSQFIVNPSLTTVGTTASLSAGQALAGITVIGVIEVA